MAGLGWLVGLLLPACAGQGAAGLPVPPPMDFARISRPSSPNTALAAPDGFAPKPDLITPAYDVPPAKLFAAISAVAAGQEHIFPQVDYPDRLQAHYVARSALLNFPDLIAVQVVPDGDARSRLILYSRSVYGQSDFGVNKKRLTAWLAALDGELHPTNQK